MTYTSNLRSVSLVAAFSASSSTNRSHSYYSTTAISMSSDEVQKAKEAATNNADGDGQPPTIFDKILSGDIPANKIHDDDLCIAFRDVNPVSPVHFLVIPKHRDGLTQLSKARDDQKALLGHMMYVAQMLGKEECPGGFRVVVNDGSDGAQSVYHLHIVSTWYTRATNSNKKWDYISMDGDWLRLVRILYGIYSAILS